MDDSTRLGLRILLSLFFILPVLSIVLGGAGMAYYDKKAKMKKQAPNMTRKEVEQSPEFQSREDEIDTFGKIYKKQQQHAAIQQMSKGNYQKQKKSGNIKGVNPYSLDGR